MSEELPTINNDHIQPINIEQLALPGEAWHPPRVLMMFGSLRERSYSRLVTEEAARVLRNFGAEVKIFDPTGLPLVDDASQTHDKVH